MRREVLRRLPRDRVRGIDVQNVPDRALGHDLESVTIPGVLSTWTLSIGDDGALITTERGAGSSSECWVRGVDTARWAVTADADGALVTTELSPAFANFVWLRSPNQTRWRVYVDADGVLTTVED